MSDEDWHRDRNSDPRDPTSPYYSPHLDDPKPGREASGRDSWEPASASSGLDELNAPPWAIVAGACGACALFIYIIGDRALALSLGALLAATAFGGVLLLRKRRRPR